MKRRWHVCAVAMVIASVTGVSLESASPAFATLCTFNSSAYASRAPVVIGAGGVLYGTTFYGGPISYPCNNQGCGAVFSLTPPTSSGGSWTEAVIHSFTSGQDGSNPQAGLAIGGGVLYGTTTVGGAFDSGTVFSLTPPAVSGSPWIEAILYSFKGSASNPDGAVPEGPVAIGIGGVLYGVTWHGGSYGFGTVFSLTPPGSVGGAWKETVLYSFQNGSDGGNPWTGLVIGPDGVLYGMAWTGGAYNHGTVFSLKPPAISGSQWVETVLHSFAGGTDGADPYYEGGLVMGSGRVLYGTTNSGGTYNQGVLFSMTPPTTFGGAWTETVLYSFNSSSGEPPNGGLVVGEAGALYGTTSAGGRTPNSAGTIFRLAP